MEDGRGACGTDGHGGLGHRLEGAQLVIDQHHGYQHRVWAQGGLHILDGHLAVGVGGEVGDLIALPLQRPAGLQHSGVLDGGGNDVLALAAAKLHRAADGPVVSLAAAGGKIELLRGAAQSSRYLGAVLLHPGGSLAAQGVAGGGVAPPLGHGLHRGLYRLRTYRRGGRVI